MAGAGTAIGTLAGTYFGAPWLGGALGGAVDSLFGGGDSNEANAALANENRKWMEAMSDTSYQRAVRDMQKAGLNPMLAYSQGGASAPTGSPAVMQNFKPQEFGALASSAQAGMGIVSGLQQVQQSKAQEANLYAQAEKMRSETLDQNLNTALRAAEVSQTQATAKERWVSADVASRTQHSAEAFKIAQGVLAQMESEMKRATFESDIAKAKATSQLVQQEIPKSKAEAEFWKTDFGEMSPWIKGILQILGGANSARSLAR